MSHVMASFAPLSLVQFLCHSVFFGLVVPKRLQLQQWWCLPELQRQSEPQHVTNPNTSMQSTTVGLGGIRNPKPITAHTETRKVRHRETTVCTETGGWWTTMFTRSHAHSLLLGAVMSGFLELVNTKHTVWLRAVVIDYLANCSCAISIVPSVKFSTYVPCTSKL